MSPATYLFVPGNRPERFAKALATGAGAIILDLEDAVAPDDKALARQAIADWLAGAIDPVDAERIVVRINDARSRWFEADLAMISASGLSQVMLPKTESPAQVATTLAGVSHPLGVLPLIESARGIAAVENIAAAPGVCRLAFGTLDYAVDLDLAGDEIGLVYAYSRIAIASRCANLPSPIAGVTPSVDDLTRIEADFAFARRFGFGAKMCIHPRQVNVIEQACQPSAAEIEWARRVLAVVAQSGGAVQLDGKMVDRPVVLKAEAILARSQAAAPQ